MNGKNFDLIFSNVGNVCEGFLQAAILQNGQTRSSKSVFDHFVGLVLKGLKAIIQDLIWTLP